MSLKSAVLTASGVWRAPFGVSFVWINTLAGGAGGNWQSGGDDSADAGGAGEFCIGMQVPVVPGTLYAVTVGTGGAGGIGVGTINPEHGNPTTFAGFPMLGGFRGDNTATRGNGGGPNGGITPGPSGSDGIGGTAESPTAFGGASGGVRGGSVGFRGGYSIAQYLGGAIGAPAGGAAVGAGGCGGASSVWGAGGMGGDAYDGSGPDPDDGPAAAPGRDGGYGSGGGGPAQDAGGTPDTADGGAGGAGLVQIMWVAP